MSYYFDCPKCRSNKEFAVVQTDEGELGCLLFLLGGILPWLLYEDSTKNRVQCTNCGHIFRQPPLPRAPIANYAIAIIILIVLTIGSLLLMAAVPELTSWIPNHAGVEALEDFVAKHPEAVVASVVPLLVVLVISAIIVSIVANRRYRLELRGYFEMEPKPYSEIK
ncbi:MAG: hypothetical protein IT364_14485 [Candidatus Hydrogenedentes bacterium]|nr:hypothetical protein [Candidatus Hydrogenedentota bacterium]